MLKNFKKNTITNIQDKKAIPRVKKYGSIVNRSKLNGIGSYKLNFIGYLEFYTL